MTNRVLKFPPHPQQISKATWVEYVELSKAISEVEEILGRLKAKQALQRAHLMNCLENGASIEDGGRIT